MNKAPADRVVDYGNGLIRYIEVGPRLSSDILREPNNLPEKCDAGKPPSLRRVLAAQIFPPQSIYLASVR